jgi:hypothetical protein
MSPLSDGEWGFDGMEAVFLGCRSRSSPAAAKRGVADAGLEVDRQPRDDGGAVLAVSAGS